MALPSRDMHLSCLRCGKPLDEDERYCGICGADREIELAIAGELNPAISSLRRWLMVLGALSIGWGLLIWEHFHGSVPSGALWWVVAPTLISGLLMFALCAFARRAPFVVSSMALGLFGLQWLIAFLDDPVGAFAPGMSLAVRSIFLIVLVGAVKSGHRARKIRQTAE